MLGKFSVKRPFIVLAAVIVILMLGGVSLTYMKTNLLPDMELPYLMVITSDPGASPEQVENDVTNVLEGQLATVTGVENVTSESAENYSMISLEFAEDTNMDSALVKVSAAVNQVSDTLPDTAGSPTYIEMNMDTLASMYIGVADSDKDITQTTAFVDETVIPSLERLEGVAQVSTTGMVVESVDVQLSDSKIENVNNRLLNEVNGKLAESKTEIDDAQAQLDDARATIESQQEQLSSQKTETQNQLAGATEGLNQALSSKSAYEAQLTTQQAKKTALEAQYQAAVQTGDVQLATQIAQQIASAEGDIQITQAIIQQFNAQAGSALSSYTSVESGKMDASVGFATAQSQLTAALQTIEQNQTQLDSARTSYEDARDQAIDNANIDALVDGDTLSQLITAQNFVMPAGYIENEAGKQWLLKVGQNYASVEDLSNTVLTTLDGVGDVRLCDVADINVINNAGESFAKLNGDDGIILSISKSSTASTSDVSRVVNEELSELQKQYPTMQVMNLSDQGKYITLYINTILQSLLIGALLAILVLALFLKNVRPTLVVAFSIPFSVLFSLVIMYFTGISINIMSLGALSVSIGMLVDSSIVVMENIYRLRSRGYSSARAAAQGAMQVTGAIVASTLTTVCVFLPFVFTTGYVRQLMVPFALTISYTLIASLIVALTVVPALGSKMFEKSEPKPLAWFEKLKNVYERALRKCLNHKAPVLVVAVLLLGVCIAAVLQMGIVMIPNMESDQISITAKMPDEMPKEEAYQVAAEVLQKVQGVEGIGEVGGADNTTAASMVMGSAGGVNAYTGSFSYFAIPDESVTTEEQIAKIRDDIQEATAGMPCEVTSDSAASMTSSLSSAGIQIHVRGDQNEVLLDLSDKVMDVLGTVDGFSDIRSNQEEADPQIQLIIDRNKAAQQGTTVAQIFQQIAGKLNSTTESISVPDGEGDEVKVNIENNRNQITAENLLDMEYTTQTTNSDGAKVTETHKLWEVATSTQREGYVYSAKENGVHYMQVRADIDEGYNITLLEREVQPKLDEIDVPRGYSVEIVGTNEQIEDMLTQMTQLMLLGAALIYLVMMAQFRSFSAPFIVILTVPLAFTGGLLALMITGEQLSMMSLLGFVILMGTVVNNGIVFVDYANQMRLGGLNKREALILTGRTRMRPIMMTALTTILSMAALIFSPAIGSGMQRGMALVVAGGLLYATFMTLFVVPIMYDILCRRPLKEVDVGEGVDEAPNDAADYLALLSARTKAASEGVMATVEQAGASEDKTAGATQ